MWPGIVVLVGILFWLGFIFGKDHDPGLAFVGTIVTLTGLFFFLFTFNVDLLGLGRVDWGDMALLWPAFPLIVGIAFVVLWAAGRFRDWGVLIPAGILLLVGFGGFAFTLGNVPDLPEHSAMVAAAADLLRHRHPDSIGHAPALEVSETFRRFLSP